jgi:D-alanine-D-alanine ligase
MKIGITYDLKDDYIKEGYSGEVIAEFDRISTIDSIENALRSLGHSPERIGNIKALVKDLSQGKTWDLVFNICEGLFGRYSRESQVPALLDAYNIPYTFSDPVVQGVSLKKDLTKIIVKSFGYKTPDFFVVNNSSDIDMINLGYPLFIKPIAEGTSKGVTDKSKVNDIDELKKNCLELLKKYNQPVLVETFCTGKEFTTGITGSYESTEYVGALEIKLKSSAEKNAYSYINKENCEELIDYILVTDKALNEKLKKLSIGIWKCLECRDAGRIDFMLDKDNELSFIEVNPLAGIHPEHSDLPILFNRLNIPYIDLIKRIIDSASLRIKK